MIYVYEDNKHQNFYPISASRPIWDVRLGAYTIARKWKMISRQAITFKTREYLSALFETEEATETSPDEQGIFINARLIPTHEVYEQIKVLKEGEGIDCGDGNIAAFKDKIGKRELLSYGWTPEKIRGKTVDCTMLEHIYDAIRLNTDTIKRDFKNFFKPRIPDFGTTVGVKGKDIYIGEGVAIEPYVVIDAQDGPVIIESGTHIGSFTVIQGPVYIGKHNIIKPHAHIYQGVSTGPVCKLGGEIETSVIQGYSNKQHQGFLGHSYLGEWVNLGADTNTSDLRNNYGNVKIDLGTGRFETNMQFLGSIIGDHTKTGINTMLNTGTIIGFSCNVFGGDYPSKFIRSFTWGKGDIYKLDRAIETAKKVMKRRNIEFTNAHHELFAFIFRNREKF